MNALDKEFSTLRARLAIKGFCLAVADDGPRTPSFHVSGPGGLRTFGSLREVSEFVERVERAD